MSHYLGIGFVFDFHDWKRRGLATIKVANELLLGIRYVFEFHDWQMHRLATNEVVNEFVSWLKNAQISTDWLPELSLNQLCNGGYQYRPIFLIYPEYSQSIYPIYGGRSRSTLSTLIYPIFGGGVERDLPNLWGRGRSRSRVGVDRNLSPKDRWRLTTQNSSISTTNTIPNRHTHK